MVLVSCPVDFSGGKRERRSQYQLLSVIDDLGCLRCSGNPDIETLSDRLGNNLIGTSSTSDS